MNQYEGPPKPVPSPEPLENKEKALISDMECLEAMKAGDMEKVSSWYDQESAEAKEDPTPEGMIMLTFKLAQIQFEAGFVAEATESIEAAIMEAQGQGLTKLEIKLRPLQEKILSPTEQPEEKKEKEPITDEQAQEFYVAGNMEKFREWVGEQDARIEKYKGNPTYARMFFETKLARIQYANGEIDDAIERMNQLAGQAAAEAENLSKMRTAIPLEEYDQDKALEHLRRLQEMKDFEAAADDLVREWSQG